MDLNEHFLCVIVTNIKFSFGKKWIRFMDVMQRIHVKNEICDFGFKFRLLTNFIVRFNNFFGQCYEFIQFKTLI